MLRSMVAVSEADLLPELGVGVTYTSELEPLFADHAGLIDVIEIEPQAFWLESEEGTTKYRVMDGLFETISNLPFRKIIHSVGAPVGGTVRPHPQALPLLASNIRRLKSPWVS